MAAENVLVHVDQYINSVLSRLGDQRFVICQIVQVVAFIRVTLAVFADGAVGPIRLNRFPIGDEPNRVEAEGCHLAKPMIGLFEGEWAFKVVNRARVCCRANVSIRSIFQTIRWDWHFGQAIQAIGIDDRIS